MRQWSSIYVLNKISIADLQERSVNTVKHCFTSKLQTEWSTSIITDINKCIVISDYMSIQLIAYSAPRHCVKQCWLIVMLTYCQLHHIGTNFSEIRVRVRQSSFKKIHLKIPSAKLSVISFGSQFHCKAFPPFPSESLPLLKTSSAKWQPSSFNVLTTPLYSTEMFLSALPLPQWMGREFWDNWNIMGKWHQSEWRPIIIISIHSCHQGAARETIRPHTQGRGWWKGSAHKSQKTTATVWDSGCSALLLWWRCHQS